MNYAMSFSAAPRESYGFHPIQIKMTWKPYFSLANFLQKISNRQVE